MGTLAFSMTRRVGLALIGLCCATVSALAATIDTEFVERPWPEQRVRHVEVGRDDVAWREHATKREGIFAGVRFTAPLARQAVWDMSADYQDLGTMTPGVSGVRILDQSARREVIQVDIKVLWKRLSLTFEIERDPPGAIRYRLMNEALGEYRGVCLLTDAGSPSGGRSPAQGTTVELSTWLKPSRPVPVGLLLVAERIILLQGVRTFLKDCQRAAHP